MQHDLTARDIDNQISELENIRTLLLSVAGEYVSPPKECLHPGDQLGDAERLDEIIVRAHFQTRHLVGLGRFRGEHQDGREHALAPQAAADLQTVDPRQHHVENDQIVCFRLRLREPGITIEGKGDVRRHILDMQADEIRNVLVIFDHENTFGRAHVATVW